MREFKCKGAIVRPYEPFAYNKSEKYFRGSIRGLSRTVLADGNPQVVIIEVDEETDIVE